jgi:hypothetical protein
LVGFSREQLAQKSSPQDSSMFQGMFDIGIGMIAFEQHWLALFSLRTEVAAPCPEDDLCKLAEVAEPVRATSPDGREHDANCFGRNV